jgi:aspartyl-tRNA synthetase
VKLKKHPTNDEIFTELTILNAALTPPFTIEDDTDGGRHSNEVPLFRHQKESVKNSLLFRHKVTMEVRKYLI